eukprot:scaffold437_cov122-Isochrysis_galbana.AAC.10
MAADPVRRRPIYTPPQCVLHLCDACPERAAVHHRILCGSAAARKYGSDRHTCDDEKSQRQQHCRTPALARRHCQQFHDECHARRPLVRAAAWERWGSVLSGGCGPKVRTRTNLGTLCYGCSASGSLADGVSSDTLS